ncbi:MAG: sigma-54-dependent Fis family transcriptional regulator [Methylococcales bacterium]|jgi:sigma-54 dependent transcriptional regulator, flagellar regulatory protein|nr:sigma-54-dependent Fis family transcriptional regulator [Methylococcales bacterium]MBT7410547.1 sigma-54-dependent Fis family transcriptional regulator [Methylococcales bacterium]
MGYAKILIVDENENRVQELKTILEFIEYEPVIISDVSEIDAMDIDWESILVAFIGANPDLEKINNITGSITSYSKALPFLMFSTYEEADAIDVLPNAIIGLITLPLKYTSLINSLHKVQVYKESLHLKDNKRSINLFRSLVGHSKAIQQVRNMIEQVADSEATVLILGESGTGKEVVARNIHFHSVRKNKPFVPINCGAIPPDLLESELFGHEKGAFTGAITARKGRFELAHEGTLFLDEIGDMPFAMQVKLLRVLQERTFERVGGSKQISIDVRVIAATHRNLDEMIKEEKFREDLYYRLNVFPIYIPPLNKRSEDVPLLLNDLISRVESDNRGSVRVTPAAIMALSRYSWPGNIRELANLVERLAILYPYGVVDVTDLPDKFRSDEVMPADSNVIFEMNNEQGSVLDMDVNTPVEAMTEMRIPAEGIDLKEHLGQLEYSLIKQALDESNGVVAHAAKRLSMRRTTLVEKLKKYDLHKTD